mmetsp:Transcript_8261/g.12292  ORF Transcript_8261/g.12292 Transcript_8261/m.12292 type:complete len:363 (-) Transcript_8261:66-1154(-)|eukprot:CAMPEP_0116016690 /NCGR_PEP_ID=MMETSP0321-20121206/7625_1 /TAXON_ID=163516 /ORGANISM="Leptocylindrus danicus var. danicus, Strain B650" /LENGTH=362 /DNA_ID=CAMNT_0003486785 /DNA_START=96 /DNA_END=1184 /DNA_ORIENTATION=-
MKASLLTPILALLCHTSSSFSTQTPSTSSNTARAFHRSSNLSLQKDGKQHRTTRSSCLGAHNNDDDDGKDTSFPVAASTIAGAVNALKDKIVVVKYGGNAMTSPELFQGFCEDVATLQNLGIKLCVVHGGGPQISNMLKRTNVESRFEGGLRVSSKEVVEVAEMVLCGSVNKDIAAGICRAGGKAVGLSGKDNALLQCIKQENPDYDLEYVGNVQLVNTDFLRQMLDMGITPVISPIGSGLFDTDDASTTYNINADVAAGRVAGELVAARVLFLTDIKGVCDKNMDLIPALTVDDVQALIDDETITGGMIPKVSYAVDAVKLGVAGAFITDGRVPHALLNEILGGGGEGKGSGAGGTIITKQ